MKSDNMTRVSLKEAYDNKDVIAQIYAIRDTAESAEDSAEQAVTTANTASDHVDALVPQVEGAVQNANSASASAQASAQTVAGYENRLATVETDLGQTESDLNAVTLRVTTAEGQIVTIQGRVTALETADGQNVKLTGEHAIGNYAVLLTGNQRPISGIKTFAKPTTCGLHEAGSSNTDGWRKLIISPSFGQSNEYAIMLFDLIDNKGGVGCFSLIGRNGTLNSLSKRWGNYGVANVKASMDSNGEVIVWCRNYRCVLNMHYELHAGENVVTFVDSGTRGLFDEPTTDTYAQVITAVE